MPRFDLMQNPAAAPGAAYGPVQAAVLNEAGLRQALAVISGWPGYAPTPLLELSGLARATGVATIRYKDEGQRFALKSFKPLGGAYAVARLLMAEVPARAGVDTVTAEDLLAGTFKDICAQVTVTAATDGNHGRAVAWGARMFGCKCVIFINEAVSEGRERAIASFGADVRRNPGSFDDAVRTTQATAESQGWHVVPDTTAGAGGPSPRHVTQGYAVMAAETIDQLSGTPPPTHLFLQAGVGGMAAATCGQFWQAYGARRPKVILVEPENAACWFASLNAGQPVAVTGDLDTLMGGLACGEISRLAWDVLRTGADAAIRLTDQPAADAMRLLARGTDGDVPIAAGESGVAGLAAYLSVAADAEARRALALDETSRIVLFGTEGATDPEMYTEIVGRPPEEIAPPS